MQVCKSPVQGQLFGGCLLWGNVVPGLLASSGLGDAASYGNVLFVFSSCVLRRMVQHVLLLPAFAYPFGGCFVRARPFTKIETGSKKRGTTEPPRPHHNVESITRVAEFRVPPTQCGFGSGRSASCPQSTLRWGAGAMIVNSIWRITSGRAGRTHRTRH